MNAEKSNKSKELLQQAEEGIKQFLESDKYKDFLKTMSQFHRYSVNNTILIFMQKPDASHVAGYQSWKKKFNRQVNKGEKSIKIIGGREYKRKVEEIENGVKVEKEVKGISFFPVSVFDVSQTTGDPLPKLVNELQQDVSDYKNLYHAIKESTDFDVSFDDIKSGAKGYCRPLDNQIVINKGMSQSQTIKTLIHEITHADLHADEFKNNDVERTTKESKEVEAESTAFIVCEHYGIDTKDYSFPYLAAWSSSKELEELKASFEKIQKQADSLIQRIDTNLESILKEKELEVTQEKEQDLKDIKVPDISKMPLSERLNYFQEKADSINQVRKKDQVLQNHISHSEKKEKNKEAAK
nr:DUF6782 family putative metallopeptidase [Enterococcus sp. 665A]MBO1340292.1 ImmA/IrrE family metallo-endopeptidase [Enterococcus sp. 665A]